GRDVRCAVPSPLVLPWLPSEGGSAASGDGTNVQTSPRQHVHQTLSSTPRHKRRKLVRALAPPFVKTHLLVRLAVRHRPVQYPGGVSRLAAQVLERHDHRHKRLFRRLPGPDVSIGKNERILPDHFEINTPVGKFVA